jgi:predicted AAA+ superfamily ATPase
VNSDFETAMNIEELKAVITSEREDVEDLFKRELIVERDLDRFRVKNYLTNPNVLAILGVRRCGKSIFSWLLLSGEKFGYINFFDERLIGLKAEELNQVTIARAIMCSLLLGTSKDPYR